MNDAISPFFGSPVLLRTGFNTGFTSISVAAQVMTPDGSKFDVLYVGTSTGQLLKAVNSLSPKSVATTRPVIIEEMELLSESVKKGNSRQRMVTSRLMLCFSAGGQHQERSRPRPGQLWDRGEGGQSLPV